MRKIKIDNVNAKIALYPYDDNYIVVHHWVDKHGKKMCTPVSGTYKDLAKCQEDCDRRSNQFRNVLGKQGNFKVIKIKCSIKEVETNV